MPSQDDNSKAAAIDYGWHQIKDNNTSIGDVLDDVWEMGFRYGQASPTE